MKECRNCKKQYDDSSMFCIECGSKLEPVVVYASYCPKCGAGQSADAIFCTNCGSKLVEEIKEDKCPGCGRVAEEGTIFCPECGTKIEGSLVEPTPQYEALAAPAIEAPQEAPVAHEVKPVEPVLENTENFDNVPEEHKEKLKKAKFKHNRQKVLSGVNNVINTLYSVFWIILYGLWAAISCVFTGIAYFVGIITIPCGIVQFKSISLVFSPFKKRVVTHFGARGFWNVVWLIFGGFFLFLGTKISQILFNATFIGRRLGDQLGKLATFYLAPFGAQIISEDEFSSPQIEQFVYTRQYIYRNQFNPQFSEVAAQLKAATKEENKKRLVKNIVFAAILCPVIFMGFLMGGMMFVLALPFAAIIVFKALDIVFDFLTSWHMDNYGYGHRKAVINRYDQKSRFQKFNPERKICQAVYPSVAPYVDALILSEK